MFESRRHDFFEAERLRCAAASLPLEFNDDVPRLNEARQYRIKALVRAEDVFVTLCPTTDARLQLSAASDPAYPKIADQALRFNEIEASCNIEMYLRIHVDFVARRFIEQQGIRSLIINLRGERADS